MCCSIHRLRCVITLTSCTPTVCPSNLPNMWLDFEVWQYLREDGEDTTANLRLDRFSLTKKTKATTSCFKSANSNCLLVRPQANTASPLAALAGEPFTSTPADRSLLRSSTTVASKEETQEHRPRLLFKKLEDDYDQAYEMRL